MKHSFTTIIKLGVVSLLLFFANGVKAQTTVTSDFGLRVYFNNNNTPGFFHQNLSLSTGAWYQLLNAGATKYYKLALSDVDSLVINTSFESDVKNIRIQIQSVTDDGDSTVTINIYRPTGKTSWLIRDLKGLIAVNGTNTGDSTQFSKMDSIQTVALYGNPSGSTAGTVTLINAYFVLTDGTKFPVNLPVSLYGLVNNYASPTTTIYSANQSRIPLYEGSSNNLATYSSDDGIVKYVIDCTKLTNRKIAFRTYNGTSSDYTELSTGRNIITLNSTDNAAGVEEFSFWTYKSSIRYSGFTITGITRYAGCGDDQSYFEDSTPSIPTSTDTYYGTTITRTVTAGQWNTLVLPYTFTSDMATRVFGSGTTYATFTGASNSGTSYTLNFTSTTEDIAAGTPFIIYPDTTVTEIPEQVVVLSSTLNNVTYNNVTFSGFYYGTEVPAGSVYLAANNKLKTLSAASTTMKGFRAYFTLPDTGSAKPFSISVDGSTVTGIDGVTTTGETSKNSSNVYRLDGTLVGTSLEGLQSGIYIQNGKKVIIK